MNKIVIPNGFKVGHRDNGNTGVSVILCPDGGTIGGVDVRGCAPGTRETDLLRPFAAIEKANAVTLCGGSAYGLEACSGVMKFLSERGIGFNAGGVIVPLVAGAVIFDLKPGALDFPTLDAGYKAAAEAKTDGIKWGAVGVGTGATVGKIFGTVGACRGGIGAASIMLGELIVTAVTVVNAFGDVFDHRTGKIVAGARGKDGNFIDTQGFIASGAAARLFMGANTTLSCVITNARLDKLHANKLAAVAHDGFARAIKPVHTDYDGDTIFALASGEVDADFTMLSCMATDAVADSCVAAVRGK